MAILSALFHSIATLTLILEKKNKKNNADEWYLWEVSVPFACQAFYSEWVLSRILVVRILNHNLNMDLLLYLLRAHGSKILIDETYSMSFKIKEGTVPNYVLLEILPG